MIPEWIKNAADEIRILTVGQQILAKWNAEWNELIATIIAKHAPEESTPCKCESWIEACRYAEDEYERLQAQVRELVEAAREAVDIDHSETEQITRLRRALEPFKEVS